jgi:hypothetical protein
MDHVASLQAEGRRDARFSGRTPHAWRDFRQRTTRREQLGTSRTMNRAVDATATKQTRVRSVDNRFDIERRDVAAHHL